MMRKADMILHSEVEKDELRQMILNEGIVCAGNRKLKIYGRLDCSSGKRMKVENRVFFQSIEEAESMGYRPCGNCLRSEYKLWICSVNQGIA